jgi:hypothetical protein
MNYDISSINCKLDEQQYFNGRIIASYLFGFKRFILWMG